MRRTLLLFLLLSAACGPGTKRELRVTSYADGQAWSRVELESGVLHGTAHTWFEDGAPKSRGAYANGRRIGLWETWHANGAQLSRGSYEGGRQRGLWEHWFDDGKPASRGEYGAGRLVGDWKSWYGSGALRSHVEFDEHGLQHGVSTECWESGDPRTQARFEHGERIRERYYHENGRLLGQGALDGGQRVGHWRFWNRDGSYNSRLSGVYDPNGEKTGELDEELPENEAPFEL